MTFAVYIVYLWPKNCGPRIGIEIVSSDILSLDLIDQEKLFDISAANQNQGGK